MKQFKQFNVSEGKNVFKFGNKRMISFKRAQLPDNTLSVLVTITADVAA